MRGRFGKGKRRSEAGVAAFEQRAPIRARPAQKQVAEARLQRRPLIRLVLRLRIDAGKSELVEEQRVELRLERADRHVAAIGAEIGVVERRVMKNARPRSV